MSIGDKEIKPNIVTTKTYIITVTEYDNNTVNLSRDNNGISTFELIGILSVIIDENKKRYITESKQLDKE